MIQSHLFPLSNLFRVNVLILAETRLHIIAHKLPEYEYDSQFHFITIDCIYMLNCSYITYICLCDVCAGVFGARWL